MSIKEVAKVAGVSPSTVSRVVNGGICTAASEETQKRIWEAVRQVGYSPNHHARSLRKPTSKITPQLEIDCVYARKAGPFLDPFFTTLMHAAEMEAVRLGYVMRYYYSVDDIREGSFSVATAETSSAIILGRPSPDALEIIQSSYSNFVFSGLNELSAEVDQVLCSGYRASEMCVEYLASLGHRKISYLGETVNEQRFEGFCKAMEKLGVKDYEDYVVETPFTPMGGYVAAHELLSKNQEFTAILCANDMSAMGALKALKEHKLKVPRDVSLIGINDMETVRYLDPMLTTIHVPLEEMGKMTIKLLSDRIEGGHRTPTKIVIPGSLITRESCGPARKNAKLTKKTT